MGNLFLPPKPSILRLESKADLVFYPYDDKAYDFLRTVTGVQDSNISNRCDACRNKYQESQLNFLIWEIFPMALRSSFAWRVSSVLRLATICYDGVPESAAQIGWRLFWGSFHLALCRVAGFLSVADPEFGQDVPEDSRHTTQKAHKK